jgi:lipopolysaccharide biosynthesis protein
MSTFEQPFESGPGSFQEWFREYSSQGDAPSIKNPSQWRGKVQIADSPAPKGSVAAVVHAFYPELLPELRDLLSGYAGSLKLFVTTAIDKTDRVSSLLEGFPHPVEFVVSDNRGRDVRPFMIALPKLLAQGYDYVLKLHTKKSNHRADGDIWRRELLASLADPAELAWTIEHLRRRPDIGIVGPDDHVLDMNAYWGSNESRVKGLAVRMGVGNITPEPNVFVAGSMFVARRAALTALASLELDDDEFETEAGQTDGTLAHAVERVLTYSAAAAGLRVAAKPNSAAGSQDDLAFRSNVEYRFAPRSDIL